MNWYMNLTNLWQQLQAYEAEAMTSLVVAACYGAYRAIAAWRVRSLATDNHGRALNFYRQLWKNYPEQALTLLQSWFVQSMQPGGRDLLRTVVAEMSEAELARALRLLSEEDRRQWASVLATYGDDNISSRMRKRAFAQMERECLAVFGLGQSAEHIALYNVLTAWPATQLARVVARYSAEMAPLLHVLPPNIIQLLAAQMTAADYASWLQLGLGEKAHVHLARVPQLVQFLQSDVFQTDVKNLNGKMLQLYRVSTFEQEEVVLRQLYSTGGESLLAEAVQLRLPLAILMQAPREVLVEAFAGMSVRERARLFIGMGRDRGMEFLAHCYPLSSGRYQRFVMSEMDRVMSEAGERERCRVEIGAMWSHYMRALNQTWATMTGREAQWIQLQNIAKDTYSMTVGSSKPACINS